MKRLKAGLEQGTTCELIRLLETDPDEIHCGGLMVAYGKL